MYGPAKQMYGPVRERRLNARTAMRAIAGALAAASPAAARALGFWGRSVSAEEAGRLIRRRVREAENPLTEEDRAFVDRHASRYDRKRHPDYHRRPLVFEREYFIVEDAVAVPRNSAIVSAPHRAVITAHGETVHDRRDRMHRRRSTRRLEGLSILAPKSTNYFHFIDDFVIPIVDLHESGAAKIDQVVTPVSASGFVKTLSRAFAEACGAEVVEADDGEHVAGPFVVWRHVNPCTSWFDLDPPLVARIREILSSRFTDAAPDDEPKSGVLFLQRGGSARSIIVDERLKDWIEREGALTFVSRGSNVPEQIARFSRTRLLIGAHGAGLTNMILMPPGGRVVEVLPTDKLKSTYRMMARQLGHDYRAMTAAEGDFNTPLRLDHDAFEAAAAESS